MPVLDRDGVRLHYDVRGEGTPVVLTHGFGATSRMFAANLDALAAGHTVVTWDLRGHGRSDAPDHPEACSVAVCVADLAAVLDESGISQAVLVGHSAGGLLSLEFQLAHPERVAGLVLEASGPGYRDPKRRAAWNDMAESIACELETHGLAALRELAGGDAVRPEDHPDASGLILMARGMLTQHDSRVLDGLAAIPIPVLIVAGERDERFLAGARHMADTIPGATLEVVAGAGHAPNITHAAQFDDVVARFLRAVDGVRT